VVLGCWQAAAGLLWWVGAGLPWPAQVITPLSFFSFFSFIYCF
jgi:hypothetical protein